MENESNKLNPEFIQRLWNVVSLTSSQKMIGLAYKEFLEERASALQQIMCSAAEFNNIVVSKAEELTAEGGELNITACLEASLAEYESQTGLDQSTLDRTYVIFDDQYVTLTDYFKILFYDTIEDDVAADEPTVISGINVNIFSLSDDHPDSSLSEKTLSEMITTITGSLESQLHSVVCMAGGCFASDQSNTSDKLAVFRDYLSRYFQNSYTDVSAMGSAVTNMLENSDSPEDFINKMFTFSGGKAACDLEETFLLPSATEASQLTGASPISGIANANCWDRIAGTVKGAFKAVGNVLKAVGNIAFGFLKKGWNFVKNTVGNPVDLKVVNSRGTDYTCNKWFQVYKGNIYLGYDNILEAWGIDASMHNFKVPKQLCFDFIFGKLIILTSDSSAIQYYLDNLDPSNNCRVVTDCTLIFYPYVLNPYTWRDAMVGLENAYPNSEGFFDAFTERLSLWSTSDELYIDPSGATDDSNEKACIAGLSISCGLYQLMSYCCTPKVNETTGEVVLPTDSAMAQYFDIFNLRSSKVDAILQYTGKYTNADFVALFSRWNASKHDFSLDTCYLPTKNGTQEVPMISNISGTYGVYCGFFMAYAVQRCMKDQDPLSYPFFPYTRSTIQMPDGRFAIATDEENQQAALNFLVITAAIIIVAVVSRIAIVKLRRVLTAVRAKAVGKFQRIANKMASGQHVSRKELKSVNRWNRLSNNLDKIFGSTLQSTANAKSSSSLSDTLMKTAVASVTSETSPSLTSISKLITG